MTKSVMCHVVAGFPDEESCLKLISGFAQLGIRAIEIQFPFSDPIADGEAIMEANDQALSQGTTIARSFNIINQVRQNNIQTDIFIMSYCQKVQHFGWEAFCKQASRFTVKGLIIPDLPYDTIEFKELHKIASKYDLSLVPVLSPGMSEERLNNILKLKPTYVYLTSRRGITGSDFKRNHELERIARQIKKLHNCQVFVGFGISSEKDIVEALRFGDVAVIGSAIVRSLQRSSVNNTIDYIRRQIHKMPVIKATGE
jgi:tryptophan synthase alpha chain